MFRRGRKDKPLLSAIKPLHGKAMGPISWPETISAEARQLALKLLDRCQVWGRPRIRETLADGTEVEVISMPSIVGGRPWQIVRVLNAQEGVVVVQGYIFSVDWLTRSPVSLASAGPRAFFSSPNWKLSESEPTMFDSPPEADQTSNRFANWFNTDGSVSLSWRWASTGEDGTYSMLGGTQYGSYIGDTWLMSVTYPSNESGIDKYIIPLTITCPYNVLGAAILDGFVVIAAYQGIYYTADLETWNLVTGSDSLFNYTYHNMNAYYSPVRFSPSGQKGVSVISPNQEDTPTPNYVYTVEFEIAISGESIILVSNSEETADLNNIVYTRTANCFLSNVVGPAPEIQAISDFDRDSSELMVDSGYFTLAADWDGEDLVKIVFRVEKSLIGVSTQYEEYNYGSPPHYFLDAGESWEEEFKGYLGFMKNDVLVREELVKSEIISATHTWDNPGSPSIESKHADATVAHYVFLVFDIDARNYSIIGVAGSMDEVNYYDYVQFDHNTKTTTYTWDPPSVVVSNNDGVFSEALEGEQEQEVANHNVRIYDKDSFESCNCLQYTTCTDSSTTVTNATWRQILTAYNTQLRRRFINLKWNYNTATKDGDFLFAFVTGDLFYEASLRILSQSVLPNANLFFKAYGIFDASTNGFVKMESKYSDGSLDFTWGQIPYSTFLEPAGQDVVFGYNILTHNNPVN